MSHSSSLWMTPRNGDVNCAACNTSLPCINHDLSFSANDDIYPCPMNISQIALTQVFSVEDMTETIVADEEFRVQDEVNFY